MEHILVKVAKMHHTTPEHVRKEIELAMKQAQQSTDPKIRARWASIPCKGDAPTVEEFLTYLAELTAFRS